MPRAARRDVNHAARHTADIVRMHRKVGTAARPERVPQQLYPHMLEKEYAAVLAGVVRAAASALTPLKHQLAELLASARAARGDASDLEVRQVAGLRIVIENPVGSIRRWEMPDGTEGSTLMHYAYGYVDGVTGADGDDVDVYLGPELEPAWVYVVHQQRAPEFTAWDEDKVMLGFASADAARAAYLGQYDDPRFFGGMSTMSIDDFKAKLTELAPGEKIAHADAGEGRKARQLVDEARARISAGLNVSRLEALAEKFGKRVTDQQRGELSKQVKAALGVDIVAHDANVPAMLDHFTAENVALIKRIPARLFDDVETRVTRAFASGRRHEDLAKEIEKAEGISENAARLIARDQIGKLNGQVNASRQQELGITSFRWRTVGDERVRGDPDGLYPKAKPSHYERDNKTYSYDDPPNGDDGPELPGEPVNCRCTAEPVFDDLLDEIDTEGAASEEEGGEEGASAQTGEAPEEEIPEFVPTKNPARVAAAKIAGAVSAERRREIHGAVRGNLAPELHVVWDKEGHKFMRENAGRIRGIKDRVNAASKISEAFAEIYGSGDASAFGNEGDRYARRQEIEAKHAEEWANAQERAYYEKAQRDAFDAGDVDEHGELTAQGREKEQHLADELARPLPSASLPDDPPF